MTVMPKPQAGFHPSLPAFLFLIWALLIPLFEGETMVNADGDPARHLRHAETMLAQGHVIRIDSSSFTRPGEQFVGFEYGSQLLMGLAHRAGGIPGMAVLTSLIIAGVLAGLARALLKRGVDPLLVVVATLVLGILTNIHWLARPHICSWPLTLMLLFWLESPKRPPLWTYAVLFAVWANLHGAFLFGWLLIALYATGHVLEYLSTSDPEVRHREWSAARGLAPALGIAILATMLTPYGWQATWHVVEFFRIPWLQDLTQEFLSPDFHSGDLKPFLISLALLLVILSCRPRLPWTHLICITGTVGMALLSQRNIIQFGLVAVPLLALDLRQPWNRLIASRPFVTRFGEGARTGTTWPWVALTSGLLIAFALNHGRIGNRQILADGWSPVRFPVAAAEWGRANKVQGRVFNNFVWGGYLIWAWPELKIFIDGGTDFYGGRLMHVHTWIDNLQPGWRDSMDVFGINLALLPTGGVLTRELLREPAWVPRFCDSTAVLLSRAGAVTPPDSVPRSSCTPPRGQSGRN